MLKGSSFKPHIGPFLFRAVHNGYSVLRGDGRWGRYALCGFKYEVMGHGGDIHRFRTLKEVNQFINQ